MFASIFYNLMVLASAGDELLHTKLRVGTRTDMHMHMRIDR